MAKKTAVITALSQETVSCICKDWALAKTSGIGKHIRGEFSHDLAGKKLTFTFTDGQKLTYCFEQNEQLFWTKNDGDFVQAYAQTLALGTVQGIYLVNHLRGGTYPLQNVTLIIDLAYKLVTLILATIGGAARPRDVVHTIHFGYICDGTDVPTHMHGYTYDLVGRIIDWHYDNKNQFVVKHIYINNEHMVYLLVESHSKEKGLVEAAECDYIKIRDDIYVICWLEKGHQGMQGVALMDLRALHDVGSFFGISIRDTLESYTFAANGIVSDIGKQILEE